MRSPPPQGPHQRGGHYGRPRHVPHLQLPRQPPPRSPWKPLSFPCSKCENFSQLHSIKQSTKSTFFEREKACSSVAASQAMQRLRLTLNPVRIKWCCSTPFSDLFQWWPELFAQHFGPRRLKWGRDGVAYPSSLLSSSSESHLFSLATIPGSSHGTLAPPS